MTIITKAALADEMRVSRARVSQYVKAGLPVRSDGKLNRSEALNWLNQHAVGLYSGEDRGVNRAGRLARAAKLAPKPPRQPAQPEPGTFPDADQQFVDAELVRDVIVAMIHRTEAVVAFAVIAAGGTAENAFAAAGIARAEMMEAGTEVAFDYDVPDGNDGPLGTVEATEYPPNWPALADLAGEPVALDQWRESEGRQPYWLDPAPAEPPHPWDRTL